MKNRMLVYAVIACCLCVQHTVHTDPTLLRGSSYYAARSQSVNAARGLVGFCQFLNRANNGFEGMFLAVPEYQQSFNSPRIANYYFNTNRLHIKGGAYADRHYDSIMADYFGLSPAFESTVIMNPTIKSALVDFDLYLSYNRFYVRMHAPFCWSSWNYRFEECIQNDGSDDPFPEEYMAPEAAQESSHSFRQAWCGNRPWGQAQGLKLNRVCGRASIKGIADMRTFIGCHIIRNPWYYCGINLICAAPTGPASRGSLFFEPMIGNGKHWEIGIGFDGRVLVWEAEGTHSLSLYGTIHATRLCTSKQCRSFDFCCNGPLSRYLLLKEFDDEGNYTGTLVSASSVTTLPAQVWSTAQFDIVAMLGYLNCGLEIDFGYNAWARTREHIKICGTIPAHRYGIKGIQDATNTLTQSKATINGNELTAQEQARTADHDSPVYLTTGDINPESAAARSAFTHKFFAHVGYAWPEQCRTRPYLGLGGEVEFEGLVADYYWPVTNNAVAQWGIWLKGGAMF